MTTSEPFNSCYSACSIRRPFRLDSCVSRACPLPDSPPSLSARAPTLRPCLQTLCLCVGRSPSPSARLFVVSTRPVDVCAGTADPSARGGGSDQCGRVNRRGRADGGSIRGRRAGGAGRAAGRGRGAGRRSWRRRNHQDRRGVSEGEGLEFSSTGTETSFLREEGTAPPLVGRPSVLSGMERWLLWVVLAWLCRSRLLPVLVVCVDVGVCRGSCLPHGGSSATPQPSCCGSIPWSHAAAGVRPRALFPFAALDVLVCIAGLCLLLVAAVHGLNSFCSTP